MISVERQTDDTLSIMFEGKPVGIIRTDMSDEDVSKFLHPSSIARRDPTQASDTELQIMRLVEQAKESNGPG